MTQIYRLKIDLCDTEPPVWREVLVPADVSLEDLHKIVQTAMGWTNTHLHQFMHGGKSYSLPHEDDFPDENRIDYRGVKLNDLLSEAGQSLIYVYDFGDGWEHEITLEKKVPADAGTKCPRCLSGERNCPPEDCGGPPGFANILKALKNPKAKDAGRIIEWLGNGYDPAEFDVNVVNKLLGTETYGCLTILDE